MKRWIPLLAVAAAVALLAAVPPAALDRATELRTLGIGQLENERPVEAEATFRQLTEVAPRAPLGYADLAIALLRQQKTEEALAAIDRALALAPGRSDLLMIKGDVLKWGGRMEEALGLYRQALAAAPDDVEIAYALYRHAGSLRGAEAEAAGAEALDSLVRLRPENLVVMLQRGAAAVAAGDRAAASQAYLRVKELIWQAPPVAAASLDALLEALQGDDLGAARVPSLRLANVLKITPMYQQGQRELSQELQGVPVEHFEGEPPATEFGEPLAVSFAGHRLGDGATAGRALVSGDFDGDGAPDLARLLSGETSRLEVRRSTGGLASPTSLPAPAGCDTLRAADLDNDGHLDLLAGGGRSLAVWRGDGAGGFTEATAALGLDKARGAALAVLDYDIEGDLDLFVAGGGAKAQLYRNALSGPLTDEAARVLPAVDLAGARDAVASDLDRDGDLDLLVAGQAGLIWLDNLRQGRFADRTAQAGLKGAGPLAAVVSIDLTNDGWPDVAAVGPQGLALWRNRGGRFERWQPRLGDGAGAALTTLLAFDADNDGRADLAAAGPEGLLLLGHRGDGFAPLANDGAPAAVTALAAADLDTDGDLDLVAGGADLVRLENRGGNANNFLTVRLTGLTEGNSKNNTFGYGAVIELRAGRAYQRREVSGDVTHLGLGSRRKADALRVVWTNGVPQNRLQVDGDQRLVEEQLLKGSCPFLYAWDGGGFSFVTDLLWGAPLGLPVAPGAWAGADPSELVAIPIARPQGGRYPLRITEELWEAAFFDHLRLWVVDHPAEVEVASSLRIVPGESTPERVLGTRGVRPLAAAWDGSGREVTDLVAARDEVYADGYAASPYQGVAEPWSFTFDLGTAPAAPVRLLLDGWIFPADASLNLAVAQRSDLPYLPPRLEVETAAGWQPLIESMGHPAGKTKTMVVDTPPLPAGARRLRIVTSLWLGWDRIAWSLVPDDGAPQVVARLAPESAELRFRGFSALVRQAPNAPHAFDYDRVRRQSPWLPFPGRYTRYGEVGELLAAADDRSVILAPGDELAVSFDASALPPPAPGWRRTVFLESHGWDKDADRNTFEAAQVEPLPFRAMSGYPYGPDESFPRTPELDAWREGWLTRRVEPAQAGAGPAR